MKIRGTLTVLAAGLSLTVLDLVQRTVIAGAARLLPSRRDRILGAWQGFLARLMLGLARVVGGAKIGDIPRIPARPGVLVLMNHQSLFDIPLVVHALEGGYPRIVTRARYARGKPLISHMVRLYQYPTVDPGATTRKHLKELREAAAESHLPLVVYPEGTRTRDGEIGRFKKTGLRQVLAARDWEVWIAVADGYWRSARLADFLSGVGDIDGRMTVEGPIAWSGTGREADAFIDQVRERMQSALASLRDGRPA